MIKPILYIFLSSTVFTIISLNAFGQSHDEDHHHHHQKNEISMAVGLVLPSSEEDISAGLHLHYIRGIAFEDKLGIGAGMEIIFDEHKHFMLSLVFQYRIIGGWTVAYGPGVLFIKEDETSETQFAQHIETAYEFDIGLFHIGPMFEAGISKEDIHYMTGVHFGIDF
jgi:hypothetical protein